MSGPKDDDVREPHELIRDGVTSDLEEAEQIFMDDAARSDGYTDRPKNEVNEDDD